MNIPYGFKSGTFCEHCMELEEGSLTFDDQGIDWCIWCALAGDHITSEQADELSGLEARLQAEAHEKTADLLRQRF